MKRIGIILLPVIALILEALPFGAVLIFAPSPTETVRKTYSYFSLELLSYANFAPFATALLTCALLLLGLLFFVKGRKKLLDILFVLSLLSFILSVFPILHGVACYSVPGGLISALLLLEAFLARLWSKH